MNNEAIAEVTVAIRNLLQQGLGNDYEVSMYPPWDNFGDARGINLFLYKIEENPQWKNMDWPGDRTNPKKINRSPLSLELYYLFTPYAKKVDTPISDDAEGHRILGKAMQILHENPVLNDIHNPYFNTDKESHFAEDLKNCFEKIKITLQPMDLEEMSKLWSMGDTPYRLSVAYHVSLIQIEPIVPARPVAASTQEVSLKIGTLSPPMISELNLTKGPVDKEIHIIGSNLRNKGFRTSVKFGAKTITDFESVAKDEIVMTVPNDLKRGPEQQVTVVVDGRESNDKVFHVTPWIKSVKPQRGAVDPEDAHAVPIEINGYDLKGIVQLSIGGVAAEIDSVSENLIKTYVPNTIGNGNHDIDLIIDENPANERTFEVVPLIKKIEPAQGLIGDSVKINGHRLNGTKIRISVGPTIIITPENANPDEISFVVPQMSPGLYEVRAAVDGYGSNAEPFEIVE